MIKLININKSYNGRQIFSDFSIEFKEGQVSCIMGASGVGKTTLINIVAGIVKPESGSILLPEKAKLSYVFQEPRLLPWYSVYENLEFVIKDIFPRAKRRQIIDKYLKLTGLAEFADTRPSELSGGMAQRVSLCRAFIYPSDILCMDEPFKGLDIKLKKELSEAFAGVYKDDGRTVLFVTHDASEASLVADIIFILAGNPVKTAASFTKEEFAKGLEEKIIKYL